MLGNTQLSSHCWRNPLMTFQRWTTTDRSLCYHFRPLSLIKSSDVSPNTSATTTPQHHLVWLQTQLQHGNGLHRRHRWLWTGEDIAELIILVLSAAFDMVYHSHPMPTCHQNHRTLTPRDLLLPSWKDQASQPGTLHLECLWPHLWRSTCMFLEPDLLQCIHESPSQRHPLS